MAWASSPTTVIPVPPGLQCEHDVRLQAIDVLVLVDEHLVETAADLGGEPRLLHQRMPVEKQVVVIEQGFGLLALGIGAKETRKLLRPFLAPGKCLVQDRRRAAGRH